MSIAAGQRWISDSEPEMGLGIVLGVENGVVDILFPAAEQRRRYALDSAPLRRVIFSKGDTIKSHDGNDLLVLEVKEAGSVVQYVTANRILEEGELCDTMAISKPQDRLLGGAADSDRNFKMRVQALYKISHIKGSMLCGLIGPKVDLIPHQLSIVNEVIHRVRPRVLLADEVGLGKTIEACLIMHRLHLTGRADRVLILLPESLVHQWFVELLRRFNLLFSIFDEERCSSIEEHNAVNPFLDSQLVIASLQMLTDHPDRANQVIDAGWDMLIVDEAHHLEWSECDVSAQYAIVDQLARNTEAVLLLTATPQQLGPEGHFARLRLLDRDRFSDLKSYLKESENYEALAKLLEKLENGGFPTDAEVKKFGENGNRVKEGMEKLLVGEESVRNNLIDDLLDSFGPGRMMFRNTRDQLKGFPERSVELVKIEALNKVKWLAGLIRELGLGNPDKKLLLIVKTRAEAERIAEALKEEINVETALFHEDLTLIQRDKNAAFFADDEGAQVLLCSEIGSEGRNFQFAHHLVLYDLPDDPELLEQRIGRLDRIGQTQKIHIHVPYEQGSEDEVLARWFHEGLNAFEHNLHGATEVYRSCRSRIAALKKKFSEKRMLDLIAYSQVQMATVKMKLTSGQEKLLALNSFRNKDVNKLIEVIESFDQSNQFESFAVKLFDHLGLAVEDIAPRTYLLSIGHIKTDLASFIPEDGLVVSFERDYALSREEVGLMSMDHPLFRNALEIVLASDIGNSSFGVWGNSGEKAVYILAYYVVEVIAPPSLHVDKFLSARPVKILVNHQLADVTDKVDLKNVKLGQGDLRKLLANEMLRTKLLPAMIETSAKIAEAAMADICEGALLRIAQIKGAELNRLEDLAEINTMVTENEINQLKSNIVAIETAVKSARVRLDSLCLVWRT